MCLIMEKKVENNSHESIFSNLCAKVVIIDLSPREFASTLIKEALHVKWDWYVKIDKTVRYIGFPYPNVTYLNAEGMYERLSKDDYVFYARAYRRPIKAVVVEEFDNATVLAIALKSHPEQLPFKKWTYLQQIRLAKICNQFIQDNAMQGKRTDLQAFSTCVHLGEETPGVNLTCVHNHDEPVNNNHTCVHTDDNAQGMDFTCVHSGAVPATRAKRLKIRDIIAKHIGISSTSFERYRRIARLGDEAIDIIGKCLDEKRLDFVAAYNIAQLRHEEQNVVIHLMRNDTEIELRSKTIKLLYVKSKKSKDELTKCEIMEMLNS